MRFQKLNEKIAELSNNSGKLNTPAEQVHTLSIASDIINEIIKILNPAADYLLQGEDALENIISSQAFQNYKMEQWFSFHPIYPDERMALRFYENDLCEIKFYWLNDNSTKARISAGVMLTPNWEDRETTENDNYRVGIDFFLKKDASAILMVVSKRGNLRVMEFSQRLTHTQVEILDKISGALNLDSKQVFHETIWSALALREVNKKFYEGVAKQFMILYQYLVSQGKNDSDAKMFANRLIGRLLFVWFLRKKGVVSNEDKYFPSKIDDSTKYYNTILKPLFFQTFNTPMYNRKNGDIETPYLNGGLFEPHDNDWQYDIIPFPSNYFNDLYDHLNKYNFTTDESSPDYEQVAIDPEMLGRVFESLLAEQLTETGEQARKAKGAFYTPREIVAYMCKESLRRYLYDQLGDDRYHSGIDKLLDSPDYEWETAHSNAKRALWPFEDMNKFIPKVIGILDSLTILDPACGSGAFPMGMLQLLAKTYERLDSRYDQYKMKLNIIQNNIFGVDIEPMAVEISRLRAWLAIIVDDDGDIDPLPNLDFKFVCADSLIPLETTRSLWSSPKLQEEMMEIRNKFFNARKPKMKEEWKEKYYELSHQTDFFGDKRDSQLKSFDPFKNSKPATFFDSRYMFGIDKFDIVIGNPPYVHLEKMKDVAKKKYLPLNFTTYEARGDLYALFFERGISELKENGILTFITSNKWMRAGYGEKLRDYFVENTQPIVLIDLGGGVFESATVDTDILILSKCSYANPTVSVKASRELNPSNIYEYVKNHSEHIIFEKNESWVILNEIERNIKEKIERFGTPLKDWDIKINRGILTGLNDAFIINEETRQNILNNCETKDERTRTDQIIRPVLRGRDIKRNGYEWAGLYCIFAYFGFHTVIDEYPAIYNHLRQYESALKKRGQVRYTSNGKPKIGAEYPGQHHWLELDNNPSKEYMDDFNVPLIPWQRITQLPQFAMTQPGMVILDSMAYIKCDDSKYRKQLLAILNSDLIYFWVKKNVHEYGSTGFRLSNQYVLEIPVISELDNELINMFENYSKKNQDGKTLLERINTKIFSLYHLTEEEIKFISSSVK